MENVVTGKIINTTMGNGTNTNVRIILNDLAAAKAYVTELEPKIRDITKKRNIGTRGQFISFISTLFLFLMLFVCWLSIIKNSGIQKNDKDLMLIGVFSLMILLFVFLLTLCSYFDKIISINQDQLNRYYLLVDRLKICDAILANKDSFILRQSKEECYEILCLESYTTETNTQLNTFKIIHTGNTIPIFSTLYQKADTNTIEIIGSFNETSHGYLFSQIGNI